MTNKKGEFERGAKIALMKVGRQSYRFKFEIKGLYWKTNYIGDKIMSSKTLYGLMKLKSVIILR